MEYYFIIDDVKIIIRFSSEYNDYFITLPYNVDNKFYNMLYEKTVYIELNIYPQQEKMIEIVRKEETVIINTSKRLKNNSVEGMIKNAVNELVLLPQSSFITHGGFVKLGNNIIAFLGESGIGKTTFARKMGENCYNDERVIIGIRNSQVRVWNYPFGGREREIFLRPVNEKLSAIFFLEKGEKLQLSLISKYEAIYYLIRCTTCFNEDDFFDLIRYYKIISKILNMIPAYKLTSCLSDTQMDFLNLVESKSTK